MNDVLYERRDDGVGLITMNRPDSLNAMGGELIPLLARYVGEAAADPAVRCVVLTGAGRAFCAGGDVKGMAARGNGAGGRAPSLGALVEELRDAHLRTSYLLHTMPKPTIAMVNGHAVGAGFGLALACDLRVASDRAKFGTAFRNVALSGDFGGSYFLTKLAGMGVARELFFTAEVLGAERALELAIVNRVVPHDDLERETMALAGQLAAGPTLTYARMKENLNLAAHGDPRAVLDQEALYQRLSGTTADHRAAAQAFVEKRQPVFSGE